MKRNIARLILIPYIVSVCFPMQSSFAGSFDLTLHAGDTATDGVNWNSSVMSIKPGQYVRMTSKVTNNTSVTATTPQLNFSNAAGDTNYTKMGVTATTASRFYTTAGYALGTTGAGFNPPVQNFGTFPQDLPSGAFGSAYQYAFQIGTAYTQSTFVPTVFFSAGGVANSSTANFTVNVDVKPHIRSVSFSNSSIPNDNSVTTDLTVTVRDWNGCTNLFPGATTVTADLRALKSTYSATEALTYISCDAPSSTATFQKTGITADLTAVVGANTISIAVKDNDNNIGGPTDATFWNVGWNAGDTNTQTITVNSSTGPIPVLDTGPTPDLLGTSGSSTITWHSDKQPGTYEVRVGGTSCTNGTLLATGSIASTAVGSLSATIQATSLVSGANTIYLCATDLVANTGLATASITKDTTAPTTAIVSWTPSTVAAENVSVTWNASEAGNYVIQVNGVDLTGGDGTNVIGTYTSGDMNSVVNNAALVNGANTIRVKFTDTAGNGPVYSTNSATPYKDLTPPLPPQSVTLTDCDYLGNTGTPCAALGNPKNGVTGRDFYVDFVLPTSTGAIQEYDIYLALSGQVLTSTSTILKRVYQNDIIGTSTGVWIGDAVTTDSNGNPLILSGTGEYYTSIKSFKSNGLYSLTSTASTGAIITFDTISLPTFASAAFTSNTGITLTYSKALTGTLSAYNMSRLSSATSCFAFDTSSGTGASSVNGSSVTFLIQPLSNIAKTCTDLTIGSGAITDTEGLYNEQILTNQTVTDGQVPSPLTISTPGNNLFVGGNGAFTFGYSFPEDMNGGSIIVRFIDQLSNIINYPLPTYTTSGAHSVTLTGSDIGLIDGRTYSLKILGNDVAGNAGISPTVTGLVYDLTPPTAPIPSLPTEASFINDSTPALTWAGSTDNYSTADNLRYTIEVSTAVDFSSILQSSTAISGTTFTLASPLTTNTLYYWRVKATDQASNTGAYSSTGTFTFDDTLPVISTLGTDTYIDNTTRSFHGYMKNTDTAVLHAKITDNFQTSMTTTDISADLSSLGGGASVNPTGYVVGTGLATWAGLSVTCTDGTKNIPITATDRAGNVGNYTATVVCDNTAPSVVAGTFTSPAAAGYLIGNALTSVTWDTSFYSTEASPIATPISLEYATDGGTVWTPIVTDVANDGSDAWTPPAVDINNAKLRLTAKDKLSNTASAIVTFTIDSTDPLVSAAAITAPNGGEFLKGSTGTGIAITWATGEISDANIADTPIALEYSINSGGAWTSIATGLANNGNYLWNPIPVPARDIGTVRIRLIASDKVNRTGSDTSDADFTIDSTAPVTTINSPTTPPNNSFINDSGFDIGAVATDTNIDKGYYSFSYAGLYWNGGGWLGTPTWNQLCNSAGSCNPINTTVTPGPIIDGTTYSLTLRSIDKAGNSTDSSTYTFVGDTVAPVVSTSVQSGSYFSGAVSLIGTGSDNRSGIASVTVQIQRQSDNWYYDGANFVNTGAISLLTNTANSYANWSYTGLVMPAGDADGTQYFITYTAIDNAYKVNNTTSHTITIIKDATGPTVAAGVWTNPVGGEIWNGGTVKTLTWDPSKITDAVSGVNTVDGIIIEYSTGGIWNTVANGISNSGSYDWTLPYPLDASVTLRISARDYVGNLGAGGVSNAFSIDSIPPTIQSVETVGDTFGKIEGLRVTFSENINTAGVNTADFSYSPTTAIAGGYTIINPQTIELLFSTATGTTALTGTLTYSGTSIHDIAANLLAPTSKTVVDKAAPIITNTVLRDNNANGKIDQVLVTWSETIASTTDTTAWTLVNPLPGMGVAPTSVSVATNVATLTLAEPTDFNTGSGGLQLSFTANANYKDVSVSANLAGSVANLSLVDNAMPIVTSVATFDNSGFYAIDVNFSETITGATLSGFTLSGTTTYTGIILVIDSDTLRLVTADPINTVKTFTLTYNGVGVYLRDTSNNYLANFSNLAVTDAIAPKILTRTTLDTNGNGHIDGIRIGFSESLAGTTLGTTVSVAGYVTSGYSMSGTGLTATLTEGVNPDTAAIPLIQLQNTTLTDAIGNIVSSEVSPTAATDAVGPVVTNVRFDGTDTLYAIFSENIVGAFAPASFVLSGATATISSVAITSGSNTGTLTLSDNGITYGSSELSFATNSVADSLSNKQTVLSFAQISASVIINEVMWSSTGSSASQYIELHNLGSTPIDISGWMIDNAATNGTATLTIPAVQTIAANGYYLITATATDNASNLINNAITADYAGSLSLDPAQTGNLIFKSGAIIYDQVKANPWPAGDNNIPASMERKSTPGNGLTASNWYIAQTGVGFDGTGSLGTPQTVNIFDSTPPTITSSSPANNTLFPMGVITLSYAYTDAGGIAPTPTYTFLLEKNNGAGVYSDVTAASISSSGITASAASFTTNALAFGAYRATFTITDAAGNTTQDIVAPFFVDNFQMMISTGAINIGALSVGALVSATDTVTVTVKTVGAGFNLSLGGDSTMQAGVTSLQAWNAGQDKGFGFDWTETGIGTKAYDGFLTAISPTQIATYALAPEANGNQKTYTYTVKYGAKIDALQAAGVYQALPDFRVNIQY